MSDLRKRIDELERLEEAGPDRTAKASASVDIESVADVEISLRLDLPQMRRLLQRKTLEIRIPDAARDGHEIDLRIVYAGKLAGI